MNGLGYGDGIIDNERFGMRRFLYFNNPGGGGHQATTDPQTAADYYNYLRSFWKDGTKMVYGGSGHISDPKADINTPCAVANICACILEISSESKHISAEESRPMVI